MDDAQLREIARRDLARLSRRTFLARMGGGALALGAGGSLLAACGSSGAGAGGATTADTGRVGGTLSFLGVDGEDAKALAKPWLQENKVQLKAAYVADNDTMLTKLRTGGTKTFDVLTIGKDYANKQVTLGFVRPLDIERLSNFDGLFAGFQSAPWVDVDGEIYSFPLIWGSEPCVYDPAKWDGMPPSYTDFADKRYAGALTTIDEPYGNQWLVAKSLGFGKDGNPNQLTQAELDRVRDAWIAIKKNVISFSTAFGDQTDLLVRGEASIALNSWQAVVAFAQPKGKRLAFGVPENDGTYYWSDAYYIPSEAPNAATAYAYIDHMTSPELNAKLADELQSGCTIAAARDLLAKGSISREYDYALVDRPLEGDFLKSVVPPDAAEGDIVGKEAWVTSWQKVKAS